MTLSSNQKKIVLILFYLVAIITGFIIVEDYGIHIEENFIGRTDFIGLIIYQKFLILLTFKILQS